MQSNRKCISVCIVEDDAVTRQWLVSFFARNKRFKVVGAFSSAEEALIRIPLLQPHVVLMDIQLPRMDGVECTSLLKRQLPHTHFLMLTALGEDNLVVKSFRAGASGFLTKNIKPAELVRAVEKTFAGSFVYSDAPPRKPGSSEPRIPANVPLTPREEQIRVLLEKGALYKEIAAQMGITYETVHTHVRNLYKKLGVRSRKEVALKANGFPLHSDVHIGTFLQATGH
jgi:DNA-binding NarL/FixJ family response regulator